MTDHTQAVADALAHFGTQTSATGCTVDDITHGLALAREVRRLTALVTAQEIDIAECDAEDAAIIDRARALCHQYDITVDASVEGYTSAALRGMDAEVSRLTAERDTLKGDLAKRDGWIEALLKAAQTDVECIAAGVVEINRLKADLAKLKAASDTDADTIATWRAQAQAKTETIHELRLDLARLRGAAVVKDSCTTGAVNAALQRETEADQ